MSNYNGFTNWQTYLVDIHTDNLGVYNHIREYRDFFQHKEVWEIANHIKTYWEEKQTELEYEPNNSMFNDLINWSMSEVNWIELAEKVKELV